MIEGLPADLSATFDRYLEETFYIQALAARRRPTKRTGPRLRRI